MTANRFLHFHFLAFSRSHFPLLSISIPKCDDVSLLVKQQIANANVEKSKKKQKNIKNESYAEVNNYKKMK